MCIFDPYLCETAQQVFLRGTGDALCCLTGNKNEEKFNKDGAGCYEQRSKVRTEKKAICFVVFFII